MSVELTLAKTISTARIDSLTNDVIGDNLKFEVKVSYLDVQNPKSLLVEMGDTMYDLQTLEDIISLAKDLNKARNAIVGEDDAG